MKVRITNMRQGKFERRKFLYADLVEAETGELMIAATLDYIIQAIADREYELIDY